VCSKPVESEKSSVQWRILRGKLRQRREGTEVEVVKRNEVHRFAVLPQRWVVERTLGLLEKIRGLLKNCERKIHTTLQLTVLAFISLLLKRY
jgi:transposase